MSGPDRHPNPPAIALSNQGQRLPEVSDQVLDVLDRATPAETKEVLGGYYVVDCKDLDEAIEVAARIPAARDGSIEIRPVVEFG